MGYKMLKLFTSCLLTSDLRCMRDSISHQGAFIAVIYNIDRLCCCRRRRRRRRSRSCFLSTFSWLCRTTAGRARGGWGRWWRRFMNFRLLDEGLSEAGRHSLVLAVAQPTRRRRVHALLLRARRLLVAFRALPVEIYFYHQVQSFFFLFLVCWII